MKGFTPDDITVSEQTLKNVSNGKSPEVIFGTTSIEVKRIFNQHKKPGRYNNGLWYWTRMIRNAVLKPNDVMHLYNIKRHHVVIVIEKDSQYNSVKRNAESVIRQMQYNKELVIPIILTVVQGTEYMFTE